MIKLFALKDVCKDVCIYLYLLHVKLDTLYIFTTILYIQKPYILYSVTLFVIFLFDKF